MIKTDKMVHMGMGNENVVNLQEFAGRKVMEIAKVEKKGLPPVLEVHIHTGVAEGIIDQGSAVNHFSRPPTLKPQSKARNDTATPLVTRYV